MKNANKSSSAMCQRKKAAFLAAFAECGTITRAAEAAKIERHTHSRWVEADPEYAKAFSAASEQAADRLEEEARRRAHDGLLRMKFHQGVAIIDPRTLKDQPFYDPSFPDGKPYFEHEYSDTLLIFLLKGARPEKFRENVKMDHAGEVKHTHTIDLSKLSVDELRAYRELRLKMEATKASEN